MFNRFALSFALVLTVSSPALATIITPGGTVTPEAFNPASFANVTFVSPVVTGTISPGTFSATYQTAVVSDPNNVFCSGCLDFGYQVNNSGPGVVERITMFNFDSFSTSVGYISASGAVNPVTVDRTTSGGVLGFSFDSTGLMANKGSATLIIETNARSYTNGLISIQDGSAGTGAAFQPTATPEPASMFLLGVGLIGIGGFRKKLFRRS